MTVPAGARTIDEALAEARSALHRLDTHQAEQAVARGALLVDIRPALQRELEGEVPGALILERNVLEWRLDPRSDARVPEAAYDLHVVVLCSEGYTSSLAAASLQQLGIFRATDLVGGFRAWQAAGLPTVAGGTLAGHRTTALSHPGRPLPAPAPHIRMTWRQP